MIKRSWGTDGRQNKDTCRAQKGEQYLRMGRDLQVGISKSLASDFHSELRMISVLGWRFLKRAEEMANQSAQGTELSPAQIVELEREHGWPGEREEMKEWLCLCHQVHSFLHHLGYNPALRTFFSLSSCTNYSAIFYFKHLLQRGVPAGMRVYIMLWTISWPRSSCSLFCTSLSDLWVQAAGLNLSIVLFITLTLIIGNKNTELEKL